MVDRNCKSFAPNIFNKNKCQNCYRTKEAHSGSPTDKTSRETFTMAPKPTSSSLKSVIKSGVLELAVKDSSDKSRSILNWQPRRLVLNSAGQLEFFAETQKTHPLGSISLNACSSLHGGEEETGEALSIALHTARRLFYIKTKDSSDLEEWTDILRSFVPGGQSMRKRSPSEPAVSRTTTTGVSYSRLASEPHGMSTFPRRSSSSSSKYGIERQRSMSPTTDKPEVPRRTTSHRGSYSEHDSNKIDSLKVQLEEILKENQILKETLNSGSNSQERIAALEAELQTKTTEVRQLQADVDKAKDYQKAVIIQEKELLLDRAKIKELKEQCEEAERKSKYSKGKLEIHSKELAEARGSLQEANNIISIHKANVEALKSELFSVRQQVQERRGNNTYSIMNDEPESEQIKNWSLESDDGSTQAKDLEAKSTILRQKLKQNEKELLLKTKELEKANESRSKVAKYTRSLLQELEAKLASSQRKVAETEEQLINKTLELEYETEQRARLEKERDDILRELERFQDERRLHGLSDANESDQDSVGMKLLQSRLEETEQQLRAMKKKHDNEIKLNYEATQKLEKNIETTDHEAQIKSSALKELKTELEELKESSEKEGRHTKRKIANLETNVKNLEETIEEKDGQLERLQIRYENKRKEVERLHTEKVSSMRGNDSTIEHLKKQLQEKDKDVEEKEMVIETLREDCLNERQLKAANEKKNEDMENQISDLQKDIKQSLAKNSDYEKEISDLQEKIKQGREHFEKERKNFRSLLDSANERVLEIEKVSSQRETNNTQTQKMLSDFNKKMEEKASEMEVLICEITKRDEELITLKSLYEKDNSEIQRQLVDLKTELKEREMKVDILKGEITERDEELQCLRLEKEDASMSQTDPKVNQSEEFEIKIASSEAKIKEYEEYLLTAREKILEYEAIIDELESTNESLNKDNSEFSSRINELEILFADTKQELSVAGKNMINSEEKAQKLLSELEKVKLCSKANESELTGKMKRLEKEIEEYELKLQNAEETLSTYNSLEQNVSQIYEQPQDLLTRLKETEERMKVFETSLKTKNNQLIQSEEKVMELAQELEKRLNAEQETVSWVQGVESNLVETEKQLHTSKVRLLSKAQELDREKITVLDAVEISEKYSRDLENALNDEKRKVQELEDKLINSSSKGEIQSKNSSDNREKESLRDMVKQLERQISRKEEEAKTHINKIDDLESQFGEAKRKFSEQLLKEQQNHRTELQKIQESIMKSESDESVDDVKQKLTSRIITLQSDISELKANHFQETERLKAQFKRELNEMESSRSPNVLSSIQEGEEQVQQLQNFEKEYEDLKSRHAEEIKKINTTYEKETIAKNSEIQELKTQAETHKAELETMREKHASEIEALKNHHQEELEQTKQDMMTVIQAMQSNNYSMESDADDSIPGASPRRCSSESDRDVERLKEQHEKEIKEMKEKHAKELEQAQKDMIMVLQASQSHDYIGADTKELQDKLEDLEKQLEDQKSAYEEELIAKESEHDEEIEQLKADMLMALQAASHVSLGSSSRDSVDGSGAGKTTGYSSDVDEQLKQLKEDNTILEKNIKKSEAATRFGLRRNEDLGNKIYQMQKEMEALDHKYSIELQMYKEALERARSGDKSTKDPYTLASENERLSLQLKEMELKIESISNLYEAEIKLYKAKLAEESNANFEEMKMKIQTLENFIEEMKFEFSKEDQRQLKQEYDRKIKDLERQVFRCTEASEKEINLSKDEIEDLKGKLEIGNQSLKDLKHHCKELEEKVSDYEQDIKNYKRQLDELKSGKNSPENGEESEERKREIQRRLGRYERELERYKNKVAVFKNQEKVVETLREEVDQMKKKSEDMKADYETQISEYKHQVDEMKDATERAGNIARMSRRPSRIDLDKVIIRKPSFTEPFSPGEV